MTTAQEQRQHQEQAGAEGKRLVFEVEGLADGRYLASLRLMGAGTPRASSAPCEGHVIDLARQYFDKAEEWNVRDMLAEQAVAAVASALAAMLGRVAGMEQAEARARAERERMKRDGQHRDHWPKDS